jgi:Domain of unknown function (DUF4350)
VTTAATATTAGRTGRGRSLLFGVVLVVVVLVVALVAGSGGGRVTGPALSPRSVGSSGTRGLLLFLQERGVRVHISGVPDTSRHGVALLLEDDLSDDQRTALRNWVRSGNTLVVADPLEQVGAPPDFAGPVEGDRVARQSCDVGGLGGLDQLDVAALPADPLGDPTLADSAAGATPALLSVPDGAEGCFGDGANSFVVSQSLGDGTVVNLGSPLPLVNARLDQADNAALAAVLLTPADGGDLVVVQASLPGAGSTTVLDLIPTRVKQAFVEAVLAFVLYAAWRARRLGRPVQEHQPVAIPGSALVEAVGGLRRRHGGADQAAHAMREQTLRRLAQRYGLGRQTPPDTVATVVAQRTGLDRERLLVVLTYRPIVDEAQLVAYVAELDRIRQEVLDGPGRSAVH